MTTIKGPEEKSDYFNIDQAYLVRSINTKNIQSVIGEKAYWLCSRCNMTCPDCGAGTTDKRQHWVCPSCGTKHNRKTESAWRTTAIEADGAVTCPVCSDSTNPASAKANAYLAQKSRLERVYRLFEPGGELESRYIELEEYYADFITQEHSGLPKRSKQQGYSYFGQAWNELEELADYLLCCLDNVVAEEPVAAYSQKGLARRYFRGSRASNIRTVSDMSFDTPEIEARAHVGSLELAEMESYRQGHYAQREEPTTDFMIADTFPGLTQEESQIAKALYEGYSQVELQKTFQLSSKQLRTRLKHIRKTGKKSEK